MRRGSRAALSILVIMAFSLFLGEEGTLFDVMLRQCPSEFFSHTVIAFCLRLELRLIAAGVEYPQARRSKEHQGDNAYHK